MVFANNFLRGAQLQGGVGAQQCRSPVAPFQVQAKQAGKRDRVRAKHAAQRKKTRRGLSCKDRKYLMPGYKARSPSAIDVSFMGYDLCMTGQDGTAERPRLAVFRSNNNIYAQVIDDSIGHTLAAMSTISKPIKEKLDGKDGANKDAALLVGKQIAELCSAKNISRVFFDRGGLKYHGRVQALAEGAREGGLEF